ncbi:Z-ring formation inhibitor MciZ [Shouchella sp. JSM 1781072]|uniref:Z-ring formation inhibitor MciZ n=1 Tax=Bacillaceae TaxID=186817 RepID=UPI00159B8EAF|nr:MULTISPECIES: hypothetical protein [Bacillaceae]UTR08043.1 hypothetical protein MM326_08540 [Alkalihalobacillus sp. LMS6]
MKKHIRSNQLLLTGTKADILFELKKAAMTYTLVTDWILMEESYGSSTKHLKRIK